MTKHLFPILLLFATCVANAQNTMYFMDRVPQSISCNPAIVPEFDFHIGFPALSGISTHIFNSGFNYNQLEEFSDNLENENYKPKEFIQSLGEKNTLIAEVNADILSFGFKTRNKGYFAFDLKLNSSTVNASDPNIIYLFSGYEDLPNEDFPISINEMDLITTNYISTGFTYSRAINEQLTIGIRPIINFNYFGTQTSNVDYVVEREENTERFEDYDGEIYEYSNIEYNESFSGQVALGMPVAINPEAIDGNELDFAGGLFPDDFGEDIAIGDFFKNASLSLDLGATYKLEKWMFSASLIDLGKSKWKNNTYHLNGVMNDEDETVYIEEERVKIGIPTKLYLGANRQFSPKWNYGFVFKNTFYGTGSNASATLSLNGYVGSALSTSVSYTAGYKWDNLGLGLRLRFFPGTDLYFVTDNIIQLFNYRNAYRFSAAFGLNISIGAKKREVEIQQS